MRPLPSEAIFTRADARNVGWSDSAISRAVRSGRIVRVRQGHFAVAAPIDPCLAARAAALACRGSVISHRSAALLHGLPLLHSPPGRPDLTVQPRRTGDVAAALLHRAGTPSEDVVDIDGAPVTSVPRTLIDLGRTVSVGAAVVTIDAALHRELTDTEELLALLKRCASWPRARRAAAAVKRSDGRAESPLESVSRLVFRRLGLPTPQLQAVIRDEGGCFLGRCDFYWDEFGVFGEADGRGKYDERPVLTSEKLRQEGLENAGLVGVRWGWDDARYRQSALEYRIRRGFERGRLRDASGFPRSWSVDAA
jgi:putative AbiEi antitoxin of type IV toxin-antitoxin system